MAVYLGKEKVNLKGGINVVANGLDTSDATANENDIAYGKTAYVNNKKVTGKLEKTGNGAFIWSKHSIVNGYEIEKTEYGTTVPSGMDATIYSEYSVTEDGYFNLCGKTGVDTIYGYCYPSTSKSNAKTIYQKYLALNGAYEAYTGYRKLTLASNPSSKEKGSILGYISSDDENEYPSDGIQNNYWYVKIEKGSENDTTTSFTTQEKTVTPTRSEQTVIPDNGYDALSKVTVKGDNNLLAENIKSGITIFNVTGTYSSGTTGSTSMPTIEISDSGLITAKSGSQSTTKQLTTQGSKTYTPGTQDQTILGGRYLTGTQTIKGDSNLIPSNIKSGVTIFNVTGTYTGSSSGSTVTSDNNCEAYLIDVTNPVVSFKTTGTIKVYGYAYQESTSTWMSSTTMYAFDGNQYYKSASYGSPSATSLSLSVSNGKLTGLPELTGGTLLATIGV